MTALTFLTVLLACEHPGDSGGPDDPARNGLRVRMGAEASDSPGVYGDLTLSRFSVRISDNVVEAEGPDGELSVSSGQPAVVDVLTGAAVPDFPVFDLTTGTYAELEYEARLASGPNDHAIEVAGTWDEQPFRLIVDEVVELEAERESFALGDGADATLQVLFRPSRWLEGLSWSDDTEDEGPEDSGDEEPEDSAEEDTAADDDSAEDDSAEEPPSLPPPPDGHERLITASGPYEDLYGELVERIVDSVIVLFPGEDAQDP